MLWTKLFDTNKPIKSKFTIGSTVKIKFGYNQMEKKCVQILITFKVALKSF